MLRLSTMEKVFFLIGILLIAGLFFSVRFAEAVDGSGTNTVSPTSVNAGSTGNTATFTFTASETMNSGEVAITVPTGWTAAQGTNGVAGYTTVASSLGTIATVLDSGDSTSVWSAGSACVGGLTLDGSIKQEGGGSISCANIDATIGNRWYKNISAQNWSGYTKVAFWIKTSGPITNANRLRFAYDDSANLASPIEVLNLSQTITANTWTYIVISLGATTRTAVTSFGFDVNHNGELDSNTVRIDDILIGPGLPTFYGSDIRTRLLQLTSGQSVTLTYGSGGGANGVTSPASGEISTFTTRTRIADSGTLSAIGTSPTITVNNPAPTTTGISPSTKAAFDSTFTLTVTGTNFIPSSVVQFNALNRTTTYASATQLTAEIPSSDLLTVGNFNITVSNATPGGGTSNAQTLTINNPLPVLSSITPESHVAGGPEFTLTINGSNFVSGSTVRFAGSNRATTFVDSTQLTATILAEDVALDGTFAITVSNPTPGGGISNSTPFTVSAIPPPADTTPPSAVSNLTLSDATVSSLRLSWTAPGDDDTTGTATSYDVRYSTALITAGNFSSATQVSAAPAPDTAGGSESFVVTGLTANTTYYFALKASDEVPNTSTISNVPTETTLATPDTTAPVAISTLALSSPSTNSLTASWTAPGDDDSVGTATSYDVRYSTALITAGNFSSATLVTGEPTPQIAGTIESMTVTGLSSNTTYFFAIKTADEIPNTSTISNIASAATSDTPTPAPTPATSGSGGGVPAPRKILFSGQAYPGSTIEVLQKNPQDDRYTAVPMEESTIRADGSFVLSNNGMPPGDYLFALRVTDKDGETPGIMTLSASLHGDLFEAKNIFVPPTLRFENTLVTKNNLLHVMGYALPGSSVALELDGSLYQKSTTTPSGLWEMSIDTQHMHYGEHHARVRETNSKGVTSNFGIMRIFRHTAFSPSPADLNTDGVVTINDWSIFLFRWGSNIALLQLQNDINNDGKMDIFDFSIFLNTMKL